MRCKEGENDIKSQRPDIAKRWHISNQFQPNEVALYSHKEIHLTCPNHGGYYKILALNATRNIGCGICTGKQVLSGYNDLEYKYPELSKEWDNSKNKLNASEVACHSNKKYWWKCKLNHSWESTVYNRHINGCPYCAGQLPITGYNDLLTLFPEVCSQWDYSKNKINPSELLPKSNKRVYWICAKGHSTFVAVEKRTQGKKCYKCSLGPTSKQEKEITKLLSDSMELDFEDTVLNIKWRKISFMRVDMCYENIVVEFDGSYWHRNKYNIDHDKTKALIEAGYLVVRIRENPLESLNILHPYYLEIDMPRNLFGSELSIFVDLISKDILCKFGIDRRWSCDVPNRNY